MKKIRLLVLSLTIMAVGAMTPVVGAQGGHADTESLCHADADANSVCHADSGRDPNGGALAESGGLPKPGGKSDAGRHR